MHFRIAFVFLFAIIHFHGCRKNESDQASNHNAPSQENRKESSNELAEPASDSPGKSMLPESPLSTSSNSKSTSESERLESSRTPKRPDQIARQIGSQLDDTIPPPMKIDQDLVEAAGIIRLQGKHVDIYTDIRDRKEFREFANVFDKAVPQWCAYFDIDYDKAKDWKVSGFVVRAKDRFRRAGLFPDHLPEFLAGWQSGREFWVYPQQGNYYTRHLVLHEGTHAFMSHFLHGTGPPWYCEGMAELLALHLWEDGKLTLRYRHKDKLKCEFWGRVAVIRDDSQQGATMGIDEIFAIENRRFLKVRAYAWSWAACEFFDSHPLTRAEFRKLANNASDHSITFSRKFKSAIFENFDSIKEQWEIYVSENDYGYEIDRAAIVYQAQLSEQLPLNTDIDSARGWQSTGLKVRKGQNLNISASGRFEILKDENETWPCEADGITIKYYLGRPIGSLLGFIKADQTNSDSFAFTESDSWIKLGSNKTFTVPVDGELFLRINESPAGLHDNSGKVRVSITSD